MPTTDIIPWSANSRMAVLREDLARLFPGDPCTAMVLSQMVYWDKIKREHRPQAEAFNKAAASHGEEPTQDTELWVYKSGREMAEELMGFWGERTIGDSFIKLVELEFLETRYNPVHKWDRKKQYRLHVSNLANALRTDCESIRKNEQIDSRETTDQFAPDANQTKTTSETTYIDYSQRTLNVKRMEHLVGAKPRPAPVASAEQTFNVQEKEDLYKSSYEAVRHLVEMTGDSHSTRRFEQLLEIAIKAGCGSAWDEALRSLESRMASGRSGSGLSPDQALHGAKEAPGKLKKPGAYFCTTLAAILTKRGVCVPAGSKEERVAVRDEIVASLNGDLMPPGGGAHGLRTRADEKGGKNTDLSPC